MGEDRRALRVHAHRQGVGDQGQDPLANGAHAVAVGDDLVVGHEDPGVHSGVLDRLPGVHGAEVVAQVHVPGGADPGEHPVAAGVDGDIGLDLGGAGDGSGQGGVVGGVGQGLLGRGGGLSHVLILGGALLALMRSSPARVMGSNVLRFGDLSDEERGEGRALEAVVCATLIFVRVVTRGRR